ncbi:MAG: hypothetical protein HYT37_01095 [Candidatus Sungbacteria bacterium]|nr:hypothetical protein [Candidatus Sungbacteria bacterium]
MSCVEFRAIWISAECIEELSLSVLLGLDAHLDVCMGCFHWAFDMKVPLRKDGKKGKAE